MIPRKGVWEPLPLIVFGYAIHPLVTTLENRKSRPNGDIDPNDFVAQKDVVPLEVGDNVYAFEQYTPKGNETSGVWYRGYVVFTTPRGTSQLSDGDNSRVDEPQNDVFIGIFPASHIHVRDEIPDPEGQLAGVLGAASQNQLNGSSSDGGSFLNKDPYAASSSYSSRTTTIMGTIHEIEREEDPWDRHNDRASFKLGPPPDQLHSSRAGLPVRTPSVRSISPPPSVILKPFPPRPSLKSGDDTISGATQPIVDEIASALREWHNLMFNYLAQRNYNLFHTVREHIDALHLGRRQLLAQTLSTEEILNLRRDCVYRLVSGNVTQGLDVIVRHPDWGGLASVDVDGEIDQRSWMSAIRMYVMQATLAYIETAPAIPKSPLMPHVHTAMPSSMSSHTEFSSNTGPMPILASSAFPEGTVPQRPTTSTSFRTSFQATPTPSPALKFYHVYLEMRAFVATPCAKGEFAELYFSLFNKSENRFLTEEFCAILNHNGVLARDPTATRPISTLFTELAPQEVQDSIYLVCRIVRKGAMRMSADPSGLFNHRGPSRPRFRGDAISTGYSIETGVTTNGVTTLPTSTAEIDETQQLAPVQPSNASGFRRPFGCAVLELSQLSKMTADTSNVSSTKEYSMPIFVPIREEAFSTLHQDLVENRTKEFEKSTRAEMIAVSIKVFHGDAKVVIRENPSLLKDSPVTTRLGFPDVVFPGDVRNEVYVKLWSGEFSFASGGSVRRSLVSLTNPSTGGPPNIQVIVEARRRNGTVIEHAISSGSGEPPVTQYQSLVFHRNNMPTFGELLKLSLPVDLLPQCHLFFTFRTRSSRERSSHSSKSENERPFAFAYFPLFTNNNAVQDGSHTLVLYRVDRAGPMTPAEYFDAPPTLNGNNPLALNIPPSVAKSAVPMKDSLVIRSLLCSTKFTHSKFLLGLLNWEEITDPAELSNCLLKFTFIGEHEIVKFLSDIFDRLFKILASPRNQGGEMDDLVFNALVKVLGIVQDRRFSNFQPVLEVYIDKHFNCPAAPSHIIHSMNRLLANPNGPETATPLRAALKVWPYIFRFIARSRELQKVKEIAVGGGATAIHLDSNFKRELRSHMEEVNRMMNNATSSAIVGTQTIAMKKFTSILPHLAKIFNTGELVAITTSFANAIPVDGKAKLATWKLIMYLEVVKGFLFDIPQARMMLVEAITNHIRPHFGRYDEYAQQPPPATDQAKDAARITWLENTRLCISIMAVMLDRLQRALVEQDTLLDQRRLREEQGNVDYLLFLFPKLIEAYREFKSPSNFKLLERSNSPAAIVANVPVIFPQSYPFSLVAKLPPSGNTPPAGPTEAQSKGFLNPGLGEVAIVFLVLMHSSSKKHLLDYFESTLAAEGTDNFALMMSKVFEIGTSILENDAFPSKWLNVNIFAHRVILRMMDPISLILRREFIPHPQVAYQFNATLWRETFYMLLTLLSSDQLVIEEFSAQRRRAVWRLGGDIRGEGASIILQLWNSLGWPEDLDSQSGISGRYGGYQVALNSLVGNVVNLCLSSHEQLRSNAVQILYGMIVSEYYLSDNFYEIEIELVNKLDSLFMSDSKGDDIARANFIDQLRSLFEPSRVDEDLRSRVLTFLNSVDQFLQLLLDVRALPEGEEYQDDRVIATLRLMNYIRRIGRDEIYIKYVHQLVNMHLQSLNYVEAALTLKLHSDLYDWDLHSFLDAMPDLGLPRQSQFHRKETLCLLILDYLGKGKAWESAIDICKELATQHTEVTFDYHRLSEILLHQATLLEHIITDQRYYSDYFRVAFYGKFPNALRNKQFVYRGYEWEKFGAFCERMLNKHPGAQLLKTADPPEDVLSSDGQWIQCTAVVPEPERSLPIFTNPQVPLAIKTHYENSAINLFSCSRQIVKQNSQGGEEVWEEKTYFTTEETFPTVLRRSEVVDIQIIEISPMENAITEVEQKTKELLTLEFKYSSLSKTGQSVSTNALTMALNGAVDNLATSQYRENFLDPDYIRTYPERAMHFQKLHQALLEQVRVIDSCLKLHSVLCPQEMLPFHEAMERMFRKNFQDEIHRISIEDRVDDTGTLQDGQSVRKSVSSHYQASLHNAAGARRKAAQTVKTQRSPFVIPPLQLGRTDLDPSPISPVPRSSRSNSTSSIPRASSSKQTPLQKHLAQLARYGMNAVSSGPGDRSITGNSDTQSDGGSPRNSIGNASEAALGAAVSGISLAASHNDSVNSHQLRGRFSRFGSGFNFGRRDGMGQ